MIRTVIRIVLAVIMVTAGVFHFVSPEGFIAIVPDWLPNPALLVAVSGVAEIAGGLGLLVPATRKWAAEGLIALFVAVFPANINMAIHDIQVGGHHIPLWALWARLPLQIVLIVWAYYVGIWHEQARSPTSARE